MAARTAVRRDQKNIIFDLFGRRDGIIVELGVDWGITTVALAKAFPDREIYAIDSWDPQYHRDNIRDGKQFDANDKYLYVMEQTAQFPNVEVVRADVVEASKDLIFKVSSIFFDAAHTEEPILQEFKAWLPKICDGGVAVVHDADRKRQGVMNACNRAMTGHVFKADMCIWDLAAGAAIKKMD